MHAFHSIAMYSLGFGTAILASAAAVALAFWTGHIHSGPKDPLPRLQIIPVEDHDQWSMTDTGRSGS